MSNVARRAPLRELGDIVSGSTPSTDNPRFWGGQIPWMTPADLTNHEGIYFRGKLRMLSPEGFDSCSTAMLPAGSIVYSSRAPIGHTAVTTYPLCTNQGFKSIVPKERLDSIYCFFALKYFTPQLQALGRGATFAEINGETLGDFSIPVPDINEQTRIAAILQTADRIRRIRRYARQMTEALLGDVFRQMFGEHPSGTGPRVFLDEVSHIQGGLQVTHRRHGLGLVRPYLRVENVQPGVLDLRNIKKIELSQVEFERTALQNQDLLLVEGNGNANAVGRGALWDGSIPDCVHQNHLIRVRCNEDKVLPVFLLHWINGPLGRAYYLKRGKTTSGLFTISTGIVSEMPITLPSLSAQGKFVSVARLHGVHGRQVLEAERQAEHLFQSLLVRAFEGEL